MPPPLLLASAIAKSFAGVRALKGVSFEMQTGEVHALIGENGAGKSTLIRIVTGVERPDSGTIAVAGEVVRHMDPHVSRSLGIAAIYQQPALFPHLTVAEHIALATERGSSFRRVDWRQRRERASAVLERIGANLAPDQVVGTLSMPEQQLVEIARAVGARARILLMDEPTASLSRREVDRLFEVIDRLRGEGAGILYISHRLEEVLAIADRVTVLRDGESVASVRAGEATNADLIRWMVGRDVSGVFPTRPPSREARDGEAERVSPLALQLRHVSHAASGLRDISLTVRRGEIVGLGGLVGAGRTELAEVLFGLRPADPGSEIQVGGISARLADPRDAVRAGLAYLPEDRRQHGIIGEMSVAANTTLADLGAVSRGGLIRRSLEHQAAEAYVARFRIKTRSVDAEVQTLSGGNQQKVALARWLLTRPAVLILDEPTQGVDVGAKAEIHALMQELAGDGLAILMISSDLPELLGMSDRIVVLRAGRIAGEIDRADATPDRVLSMALGQTAAIAS